MKTKCKNLRELNAKLTGIRVVFYGYTPTGKVGRSGEKTRHYIIEITEGENVGATCGDLFEIDYNEDEEEILREATI